MSQTPHDRDSHGGTVRIGSVLSIPAILRKFALDPVEVLAEAGLNLKLFDDPDNVITYTARAKLIRVCVARTGCNHFGLLLGKQAELSSFGVIGYLARNSPTVQSALQSFIHYFHLHVRGASAHLREEKDLACLSYNIYQPHIEAHEQIEDGAVAIAFNILRSLCGTDWQPVEIDFTHRKPNDIEPFRRYFKAPLTFDAEQSGVWFSSAWLKQSVPGNDPVLHRILQKQVDTIEASYNSNLPTQVIQVLRTALMTGNASADQIAAHFSMHSRTLNRRLKCYGTSYKELVDQTRFEIAQQLLETSELEVLQIATTLGYGDASAFTRAFRRWSDTTPSNWRSTYRITNAALSI